MVIFEDGMRDGEPIRDSAEYAALLAELAELSAAKVAELMAPGQVVLRLAARGFGVRLAGA